MSTVGIIMLVHTALDRAAEVARHWTASGCPVVVHVDKNVDGATFRNFRQSLAQDPLVKFCKRHRCEWGTWGIVAASQSASAAAAAGVFTGAPCLSFLWLVPAAAPG